LAKFTTGLYSGFMLERFVPASGLRESGSLWMIYACIACISPVALIAARRWLIVKDAQTAAGVATTD
jgi:hypothetical protein